ncbi:hypothetical protein HDV00_005802, partial [Rhizophlyctis rosea]
MIPNHAHRLLRYFAIRTPYTLTLVNPSDTDMIWGLILHSYPLTPTLAPFFFLKYLSLLFSTTHILTTLLRNPTHQPSNTRTDTAQKTTLWLRRLHIIWCLTMNASPPWPLWVPDLLSLTLFGMLMLGIMAGEQASRGVRQGDNRGMRDEGGEWVYADVGTYKRGVMTREEEERLYEEFLVGRYEDDGVEWEDLEDLPFEGGEGEGEGSDVDGDDGMDDGGDGYDALAGYIGGRSSTAAGPQFSQHYLQNKLRRLQMRQRHTAASIRSYEFRQDDEGELDDEVEELLSDTENDTNGIDETYICPGRIMTRGLRRRVISSSPLQASPFTSAPTTPSTSTNNPSILSPLRNAFHLATHLSNDPQDAMTRAVDAVLATRKRRNREMNEGRYMCVVCTGRVRDVVLKP